VSAPQAPVDENEPITLATYANVTGRSLRSVQRDVKAKRIPVWQDVTLPRSPRVTSLGAIKRARAAMAEKAEREFLQKKKLG